MTFITVHSCCNWQLTVSASMVSLAYSTSMPFGRQVCCFDILFTDCLGVYHDTDPSRDRASDQP